MGPVPESNYLLKSNTFDSIYAGGGQSTNPKPTKVDNSKLYIGQASNYYPIQSTTSFGVRMKKSKLVKKLKLRKNSNKPSKMPTINKMHTKKPKIKLVKSSNEIKQKKSEKQNKSFDNTLPKIKEGSTISVNQFGKIKVH